MKMDTKKQGDKKGLSLFKNMNLERNQKFLRVLLASLQVGNDWDLRGLSGLQFSKRVQFRELLQSQQNKNQQFFNLSIFFILSSLQLSTTMSTSLSDWLTENYYHHQLQSELLYRPPRLQLFKVFKRKYNFHENLFKIVFTNFRNSKCVGSITFTKRTTEIYVQFSLKICANESLKETTIKIHPRKKSSILCQKKVLEEVP